MKRAMALAVMLGAGMASACEERATETMTLQPPPRILAVSITPNPVPPLTPGQVVQLTVTVLGAVTQTATWSSTVPAVVSVDPTTGLVTARSPGTTVISAASTVDPSARSAVAITVQGAVTAPPPPSSITIQAITQGNTVTPINPGNVAGQIDVILNVDAAPTLSTATVRVVMNSIEVCRQALTVRGSSETVAASGAPVTIICSVNTALSAPNGTPVFMNGTLPGTSSIRGQLLDASGTVVASATFQPIVLANTDVITATVRTSKDPVVRNGLVWRSGDVSVTLVPTIYSSAANRPSSLTVSLDPSAAVKVDNGSCNTIDPAVPCVIGSETATDANSGDGFFVTFPATASAFGSAATAGVAGIEDPFLTLSIRGLVASGNPYVGNTTILMNGLPLSTTAGGANVLRLDNLAPRVTLLDITPATLGCAPAIACYVNGPFAFAASNNSATSSLARTIDLGVGAQSTTFMAGPADVFLRPVSFGGDLPESQVAQTNLLAAVSVDAMQNTRRVFATNKATCVTHSPTSVSAANLQAGTGATACTPPPGGLALQRFGIDVTAPTLTVTNVGAVFIFAFNDAGSNPNAGPSGFAAKPVQVRIERLLANETVCYDGTGAVNGTVADCGYFANEGTVTLPPLSGTFRVSARVLDQAGNPSADIVQTILQ